MTGVACSRGWMAFSVTSGMLCSTCCMAQLLINVFGAGCAGLSAFFEPMRPFMLTATAGSVGYMWFGSKAPRSTKLISTAITLVLCCTPELLAAWNNRARPAELPLTGVASMKLQVPEMKCEACRSAVISALKATPGVVSWDVCLKNKTAVVNYEEHHSSEQLLASIRDALKWSGFTAVMHPPMGAQDGMG